MTRHRPLTLYYYEQSPNRVSTYLWVFVNCTQSVDCSHYYLVFTEQESVCNGTKKSCFNESSSRVYSLTSTIVVFWRWEGLRSWNQNGFIRSAPAVADCHCVLPDRWSCGERWDKWWSAGTRSCLPTSKKQMTIYSNIIKQVLSSREII